MSGERVATMSDASYQCFRAVVRTGRRSPYVDVPQRVSRMLVDPHRPGRIPVEGLLNHTAIRTSLVPTADGRHRLFLNVSIRQAAQVEAGDMVVLALRPRSSPSAAGPSA